MNEFGAIQKYFAPLAKSFPGSLNLSDDAAILEIPAGHELIVTQDAIAEGVHYLQGTAPALIAKKLLRTNLSDLAAMGAAPYCYFLSLALPALDEAFIAHFAEGLAEDQNEFGIFLAGGDTIATKGGTVFSLTALGLVPKGKGLKRSGAKAGDDIYVSGTLGDAALGLMSLRAQRSNPELDRHVADAPRDDADLIRRYLLPEPRLELGINLRGLATSCMDISDGLLQDMGHICKASDVGAEIDMEKLPMSDAAKKLLATSPELSPLIYSGGDDYELLFTLPEGATTPEGTTKIGKMVSGAGVKLLSQGKEMSIQKTGYTHGVS